MELRGVALFQLLLKERRQVARSRDKIQQQGFWDVEISDPDHDTVCLWAYENAEAIFRSTHPELFDRDWLPEDIDQPFYYTPEIKEAAELFIRDNARPNPRVAKRTLESVLKSYTGHRDSFERIVGYADLLIHTAVPRIRAVYTSPTRGADEVFSGFEVSL